VHERPFREAMTPDAAAEVIRTGAGTEFDPAVVQAFEDLGQRAWLASDAGVA
jgi:HD-GYP domain-containing protein (c-di-GMP phosphodiesterase class II)